MALGNFGKKMEQKKRREENKKQMDVTQKNRDSANRLVAALRMAKSNVGGIASVEGRRVFSSNIDVFVSFLDNAPVIGQYDVAEIDHILAEMIDIYNEALKNGDLETSKHCVELIHGALVEFRKELSMEEFAHKEEVLEKRVQGLSEYKTVLVLSKNIFINRKNVEDKQKEYNRFKEEYEKIFKELEAEIKERPDLYEYLQDFRPGIDVMDPEAYAMNSKMDRLNDIADNVSSLKQEMEAFRKEANQQSSQLNDLKTMLSIKSGLLSKEDLDVLDKAIEAYRVHLQSAQDEVKRLKELHDKKHSITSNIFSSVDSGKEVISSLRKFEENRRKEENRQAAIAEGQRLKQEAELNEHEKQILTH